MEALKKYRSRAIFGTKEMQYFIEDEESVNFKQTVRLLPFFVCDCLLSDVDYFVYTGSLPHIVVMSCLLQF